MKARFSEAICIMDTCSTSC